MKADLRKLIAARPFIPFTIHLTGGGAVRVAIVDHVHVFPDGRHVIVHNDNRDYDILSALLIARITVETSSASGSPTIEERPPEQSS